MLHANSFEPIIFADDTNLFAKSKDLNSQLFIIFEINENIDLFSMEPC